MLYQLSYEALLEVGQVWVQFIPVNEESEIMCIYGEYVYMFICLFGINSRSADLISTKPSVMIRIISRQLLGQKDVSRS